MRDPIDLPPIDDREAKLERALIDEFLAQAGRSREDLDQLPEIDRAALLAKARAYASGRLAEIDARAHYVHELHHEQ
jgi:hypothetical protein